MATIVARQIPTAEAQTRPCEATVEDEGITWFCTREAEHDDQPHVAHYEGEDGENVIGIAWVEE